jgi:hypothetical protein
MFSTIEARTALNVGLRAQAHNTCPTSISGSRVSSRSSHVSQIQRLSSGTWRDNERSYFGRPAKSPKSKSNETVTIPSHYFSLPRQALLDAPNDKTLFSFSLLHFKLSLLVLHSPPSSWDFDFLEFHFPTEIRFPDGKQFPFHCVSRRPFRSLRIRSSQ